MTTTYAPTTARPATRTIFELIVWGMDDGDRAAHEITIAATLQHYHGESDGRPIYAQDESVEVQSFGVIANVDQEALFDYALGRARGAGYSFPYGVDWVHADALAVLRVEPRRQK